MSTDVTFCPRTSLDRLRQTLLFELLGFILAIPMTLWLGGRSMWDSGVLTLLLSVTATTWNYLFNLLFDHLLIRFDRSLVKTQRDRLLHAIGFELSLLTMTLPLIAFWLNISLIKALTLNLALMLFYLVYTYLYNIGYDRLFPLKPTTN